MKRFNKLFGLVLVMMLSMSFYTANAQENEAQEDDDYGITVAEDIYYDEDYDIFDELREFIDEDATEEEIAALEALISRVEDLEAELDQAWEDIFESGLIEDEWEDEEWDDSWMEDFTFDVFLDEECIKEDADEDLLEEAEDLFNAAMALETEEDYDAADEVWDQLFELDIYDWDACEDCEEWEDEDFTFNLFLEWEEVDVDDIDEDLLEEAEDLFNEAMAYEDAGDYDGADEVWEELFELDIYEWDDDWDEEDEEEEDDE